MDNKHTTDTNARAAVDTPRGPVQPLVVAPHFCDVHGRVVLCKDGIDVVECQACGHTWTRRCTFDDDHA